MRNSFLIASREFMDRWSSRSYQLMLVVGPLLILVFTYFLFVMYREGITYDPIVLRLINLFPNVKFKRTWVGSHFIPIFFIVVFI